MKHINAHNLFAAVFLIVLSQSVMAAKDTVSVNSENISRQSEISRKSIKVASDGTGIIECYGCGFKILKVTTETKTYLNRVEIKTADVVQQAKENVGIAVFALDSNTVYEIRFSH